MKRKIGLIVSFVWLTATFTSLILAAYNTDPLAAIAIGELFLLIIGVFICTLNK